MEEPSLFVGDIYIQGMIYALTVRSPVAKGKLLEIKEPKLRSPYLLITAKDIPGENSLANFPVPVLAEDKISYIGQPIAILAGPERTTLEELYSNLEIIIQEEEPQFWENIGETADTLINKKLVSGKIDSFFREKAKIVSGKYSTGIQEHWYPEAPGAVAIPKKTTARGKKDKNVFTVYSPSQWPYHVKNSVAGVLGINSDELGMHPCCLASPLDGKIWYPSLVACHAALAAWLSGSPVKIMFTGEEDFLYTTKRNRSETEITSSIGEKGEILASKIKVKLDLGADDVFGREIIEQTSIGALGAYNHRNFSIKSDGITTNLPPQGPFAGFGLAQGLFAAERHISLIADTLGQDPAEWRKHNYEEKILAIGLTMKEKAPITKLIDSVTVMSDYHRKWASYELLRRTRRGEAWNFTGDSLRGIGIATGFQGNGFMLNDEGGNGNCAAELTLEKDGSLEIKTSIIPSANNDIWQRLARDILAVNPKQVRFCNSGDVPDSGAATLSRNISIVTKLIERCCKNIKELRFHTPLPITVKRSTKASKDEAFNRPGWGAAVAEIEIDPITLEPKTRGIWMAVDGGKIISLRQSHRNLRTGIIQALGWTCREQIIYKDGKISPEIYRGYNITTVAEVPPIHLDFIRNETENMKGIGDLPFSCIPAAYVQAVSQAMDHHFTKIPLVANDILEAGKQKNTESS